MVQKVEIVLSLGSNFGERRNNLASGLDCLKRVGLTEVRVSPVVESPAELPLGSPSAWNKPYLNLIALGATDLDIESFYQASRKIQRQFGSRTISKWEPRQLDIDIVSWGDDAVSFNGKSIPDKSTFERPFVLSPLVHIEPSFRLPFNSRKTALSFSSSKSAEFHIPLWMGIINVTPDSFSDGGLHMNSDMVRKTVNNMISSGVHIIDIGAESTRPNADALNADEEWTRLEPIIELIQDIIGNSTLGPQISIDTYRASTAEKSIRKGVDIINDVGGLQNPQMRSIARESRKTFVVMHSVSLPVDPAICIDPAADAVEIFDNWVRESQKLWDESQLDRSRIVIDPGIGFGKSSLQNLHLMRSTSRLRQLGHRVMIGHSRKRFMKTFAKFESSDLDLETIGASLQMCSQGVDFLRVHNVEAHMRAYLSWAHLMKNQFESESVELQR